MSETPRIDSLFNIARGEKLLQAGKLDEAREIANHCLKGAPDDLQARYLLARVALRMRQPAEAAEHFAELVSASPEDPAYLGGLGEALMKTDRTEQAIPLLFNALHFNPDDSWAKTNLGLAFMKQAKYQTAINLLTEVVAACPSYANDVHANLARLYLALGDLDQALEQARTALRLKCSDPAHMEQTIGYLIYAIDGKVDEASRHFEHALEIDPTSGEAFFNYTSIKKFKETDRALIARIETKLTGNMPAINRAFFHFGLGKAYDDMKEWDLAFQNYRWANLLAKEPIDLSSPKLLLKKSKKLFTRQFLERHAEIGGDSDQPIFILGMPRSGSTLIEQILTSHPRVVTAGEIPALPRISERLCLEGGKRESFPDCFAEVNQKMVDEIVAKYIEALSQYGQGSGRIVDKLPGNLFFIGLIRLALPNAHIIHTVRNPLDTCLSCFFQPFREARWSYDLSWIGQYYRFHEDMIAHWRTALPPDVILDVHYERLVDDTESEARRIIAHCGLEWDERCLDFHRAKRSVATASLWQVRQPVYKNSKQRWVNYAPYLDDLVIALGPCAEPYFGEIEAHGGKAPKSYRNIFSRLAHWRTH
ncbi:tetratricopeptide repeat protein [Thiorhodococcus mannitoliphagus]|uniref:Tetratricopeptide repeat protein n=1 Tax=Thiorhodococcus mannitoliphagus TaxID=329406 RepID=A0A6P1E699_9GAMM|nr:tetratricopeptide repeat-containing sulfotransferase family protein [Thiorhodococcus mannitoliphagus]NEX23095.1 tetratricopeptide repeat protein [Thiorhodococcus mannitoliphagus]